ncbi:MAG: DUF4383 domain-containing protein [Pseudonocardiaceae bacterium]
MTTGVSMGDGSRQAGLPTAVQHGVSAMGLRLDRVHRDGAVAAGLGLWVFGILGLVNQLEFLSTQGQSVLGLSSNGLLSVISLIVGTVLVGAGTRGGHQASTVTAVIGALFLLSGLGNLAVLDTTANLLAFRMPNVVFSLIVGMLLLFLGLYGRVSGGLSADNPYYQARHRISTADSGGLFEDIGQHHGQDEQALIEAEIAVAEGHATPAQAERYRAEAQRLADAAHRRAWEHYRRHHGFNAAGGDTSWAE